MFTHKGTKMIKTERLVLRRFTVDDAQAMYENWASDEKVTEFLMWKTHEAPETSQSILEDWIKHYSEDNYYNWAIVPKNNGNEPIGNIAVVRSDEKTDMMHIGYCIGRKWWHKGITSEALNAVMDFLFDEVNANRIESRHDPRNPHSGGVMKKCGMKYEGTLRSSDWNNRGICDACYYALLKSERPETEKEIR